MEYRNESTSTYNCWYLAPEMMTKKLNLKYLELVESKYKSWGRSTKRYIFCELNTLNCMQLTGCRTFKWALKNTFIPHMCYRYSIILQNEYCFDLVIPECRILPCLAFRFLPLHQQRWLYFTFSEIMLRKFPGASFSMADVMCFMCWNRVWQHFKRSFLSVLTNSTKH